MTKIQITNLNETDPFIRKKIMNMLENHLTKIKKTLENIGTLSLHIIEHKEKGKNIKYCIKAKLDTPIGLFASKAWGWKKTDKTKNEILTIIQEALKKIEKEIIKKHNKIKRKHKKEKMLKKEI